MAPSLNAAPAADSEDKPRNTNLLASVKPSFAAAAVIATGGVLIVSHRFHPV